MRLPNSPGDDETGQDGAYELSPHCNRCVVWVPSEAPAEPSTGGFFHVDAVCRYRPRRCRPGYVCHRDLGCIPEQQEQGELTAGSTAALTAASTSKDGAASVQSFRSSSAEKWPVEPEDDVLIVTAKEKEGVWTRWIMIISFVICCARCV